MTPTLKSLIGALLATRSVGEVTTLIKDAHPSVTRRDVEAIRRQLVATGELGRSPETIERNGPPIAGGYELARSREDAETGSARLLEACTVYYGKRARGLGCKLEVARMMANYSVAELKRMMEVGK